METLAKAADNRRAAAGPPTRAVQAHASLLKAYRELEEAWVLLTRVSVQDIRYLRKVSRQLGLDCLVEVHDAGEMERALALGVDLVGINNRDLTTFTTDLAVTQHLATTYRQALHQGGALLVSESGLREHGDLERVATAGAQAVLVGEALMGEPDVAAALRTLRGRAPQPSALLQQQ